MILNTARYTWTDDGVDFMLGYEECSCNTSHCLQTDAFKPSLSMSLVGMSACGFNNTSFFYVFVNETA